ncbi:FkbM family methyltransferase [Balamuthia mandrillaris]
MRHENSFRSGTKYLVLLPLALFLMLFFSLSSRDKDGGQLSTWAPPGVHHRERVSPLSVDCHITLEPEEALAITIRWPRRSYLLYVYPRGDIVSNTIQSSGYWMQTSTERILDIMHSKLGQEWKENGNTMLLDVGAHVGWLSLAVAAHGYKTIAVEPFSWNLKLMQASICANPPLNKTLTLFPVGASNERKQCQSISDNINIGDVHVHCNTSFLFSKAQYSDRGLVYVETLDDILQEQVLLMKIDVEGHELFAMQGAKQLLQTFPPGIIFTEYSEKSMLELGITRPLDYLEMILSYDYLLFQTWIDLQAKKELNLITLKSPVFTNQRFYCSLWLECCTAWVDNHPEKFDKDVVAEAAATYEAKNKSPLCWSNIHHQLCCQHISGILQGFFSGLNELVDKFAAPILPKLVNRSPIHKAFLTSCHQEQPFLPTFPNDILKKNDDDDNERNHNSKEKTPPG